MLNSYNAYFDASGSRSQGSVLAVGGYIASVNNWDEFDGHWGKILKKADVNEFHMTDFVGHYKLKESGHTPFAIAGGSCISLIYDWCGQQTIPYDSVEVCFEDGDEDKRDLKVMVKKNFGFDLSFRPKKLTSPAGLRPYCMGSIERNKAVRQNSKDDS